MKRDVTTLSQLAESINLMSRYGLSITMPYDVVLSRVLQTDGGYSDSVWLYIQYGVSESHPSDDIRFTLKFTAIRGGSSEKIRVVVDPDEGEYPAPPKSTVTFFTPGWVERIVNIVDARVAKHIDDISEAVEYSVNREELFVAVKECLESKNGTSMTIQRLGASDPINGARIGLANKPSSSQFTVTYNYKTHNRIMSIVNRKTGLVICHTAPHCRKVSEAAHLYRAEIRHQLEEILAPVVEADLIIENLVSRTKQN